MGVCVDVRSIIPTDNTKIGSSPLKTQVFWREPYLKAICHAFGWNKPLWQEPSHVTGIYTSMGNGRYSLFLSLAWAVQDLDGAPDSHIDELINSVETVRRSPSEHQFEKLRGNCKVFPHLLDRNIFKSYYLPTDFPSPIHTETQPPVPDRDPDNFSIGSSMRLLHEVETLAPLVERIVSIRGEETPVPSYANYTWGSVHDVCQTLLQAARDSIDLNLPLEISW